MQLQHYNNIWFGRENFHNFLLFSQQVELQRDSERSKKLYLEVKLLAEEEVILLRQQVLALRNALRTAELESADIKLQLDKEVCTMRWAHGLLWWPRTAINNVMYGIVKYFCIVVLTVRNKVYYYYYLIICQLGGRLLHIIFLCSKWC